MVSLSRSFHTNSGGATFFSESLNPRDDEALRPILESYGTFRPLRTVPLFSFHLLCSLVLAILAIVFAVVHPDQASMCREYFAIIYAHVGLWFLTLIIDQILRCKHYNLRILGYLDFYRTTYNHHRLPMYVVSLWNAIIMLIQGIMQQFYPDNFAEKCLTGGTMSPIAYLCALITLETCVLLGISVDYIVKVRRFNTEKPPPDVQRNEWNATAAPDAPEVGCRLVDDKLYDFLEKQADLIRFLKEHNAKLGEKLMVLNAQRQPRRPVETGPGPTEPGGPDIP